MNENVIIFFLNTCQHKDPKEGGGGVGAEGTETTVAEHEFFSIIYNDNPLLSGGWEGDGWSRKKKSCLKGRKARGRWICGGGPAYARLCIKEHCIFQSEHALAWPICKTVRI